MFIQLLTYEDFVKYCHKHYKDLKDREIASIFERLQRNQLIDLQHFLDYLLDKREQRRKQAEKNKEKTEKKVKDNLDESTKKDANTLKGLILALFKSRGKDTTPLFHSSEFLRLEKILNRRRGELTTLFRQIDRKRKNTGAGDIFRGSFGYNELINYYIDKEEKGQELVFAFELMGYKLAALKFSPDSVIDQYSSVSEKLTEGEFKRLMESEF